MSFELLLLLPETTSNFKKRINTFLRTPTYSGYSMCINGSYFWKHGSYSWYNGPIPNRKLIWIIVSLDFRAWHIILYLSLPFSCLQVCSLWLMIWQIFKKIMTSYCPVVLYALKTLHQLKFGTKGQLCVSLHRAPIFMRVCPLSTLKSEHKDNGAHSDAILITCTHYHAI